jgi:ADP-ribose pyrophosphatase YjhB (NUDIX family)
MEPNLKLFLAKQELLVETSDTWGNGTLPLRLRTFVTDALPPREYITSVRSFLLQGDNVLVVRNPGGIHLLPGGRIEADEAFEDTIQREMIEETGWTISNLVFISFTHFHHFNPKPDGYRYPYPDFIQINYMAQAVEHVPDLKLPDDYEIESYFHPLSEIHTLISDVDLTHLRAALTVYEEKSHINP